MRCLSSISASYQTGIFWAFFLQHSWYLCFCLSVLDILSLLICLSSLCLCCFLLFPFGYPPVFSWLQHHISGVARCCYVGFRPLTEGRASSVIGHRAEKAGIGCGPSIDDIVREVEKRLKGYIKQENEGSNAQNGYQL